MRLSPVVAARLAAATLSLWIPCAAWGQAAPKLSKQQRLTLEAVVAAVDAAASGNSTALPAAWRSHVLRASNGAHYVALSAAVAAAT